MQPRISSSRSRWARTSRATISLPRQRELTAGARAVVGAQAALERLEFGEVEAQWDRDHLLDAAHDLFDAHLPLIRYEQQPGAGLSVRKYVLQKRGIISSSAQRKPGATITATAKAEVEYLLSRVARVDRRAHLQPQSSAAG